MTAAPLIASASASAPIRARPVVLAQIGRDLVRSGDSLQVIAVSVGRAKLTLSSSWHWEGLHDPDMWTVRATAYGPSTSTTWNLAGAGVVSSAGDQPGQRLVGVGLLRGLTSPHVSNPKPNEPSRTNRQGRSPTWYRSPRMAVPTTGTRSVVLELTYDTHRARRSSSRPPALEWGRRLHGRTTRRLAAPTPGTGLHRSPSYGRSTVLRATPRSLRGSTVAVHLR